VVELPTITIIEHEPVVNEEPIVAQIEMSTKTTMCVSTIIDLAEAQRLCDVTVEDWFARRRMKEYSDTFIAEVDKRLVMLLARKCLAEPTQALTKAFVADAIAYAISITIFK
jgi:hypothetical protein